MKENKPPYPVALAILGLLTLTFCLCGLTWTLWAQVESPTGSDWSLSLIVMSVGTAALGSLIFTYRASADEVKIVPLLAICLLWSVGIIMLSAGNAMWLDIYTENFDRGVWLMCGVPGLIVTVMSLLLHRHEVQRSAENENAWDSDQWVEKLKDDTTNTNQFSTERLIMLILIGWALFSIAYSVFILLRFA